MVGSLVAKSYPTLVTPWTIAARLLSPCDSPGKNTGVGSLSLGTIKDRNVMDLTEAEDTKKRWQEYTEELYEKRSS